MYHRLGLERREKFLRRGECSLIADCVGARKQVLGFCVSEVQSGGIAPTHLERRASDRWLRPRCSVRCIPACSLAAKTEVVGDTQYP